MILFFILCTFSTFQRENCIETEGAAQGSNSPLFVTARGTSIENEGAMKENEDLEQRQPLPETEAETTNQALEHKVKDLEEKIAGLEKMLKHVIETSAAQSEVQSTELNKVKWGHSQLDLRLKLAEARIDDMGGKSSASTTSYRRSARSQSPFQPNGRSRSLNAYRPIQPGSVSLDSSVTLTSEPLGKLQIPRENSETGPIDCEQLTAFALNFPRTGSCDSEAGPTDSRQLQPSAERSAIFRTDSFDSERGPSDLKHLGQSISAFNGVGLSRSSSVDSQTGPLQNINQLTDLAHRFWPKRDSWFSSTNDHLQRR